MCTVSFRNSVDLAHNTHLRSFKLTVHSYNISPVGWAIAVLSQVVSHCVVEVNLDFECFYREEEKGVDWGKVDEIAKRWSNLENFTISWVHLGQKGVEFIRARLPALDRRGILLIYDLERMTNSSSHTSFSHLF